MNNFMSMLVRNRKKLIVAFILLFVFGVFIYSGYRLYKYLTPDTKDSVYGDRCELTDGIDITKEREAGIKEAVEAYEGMKLSDIDIKCNLIDLIVEVDDATKVETVKEMANSLLNVFSEEELKYYDIQLWIDSNNDESEVYPIIGTRHKTNNGDAEGKFVW